MDWACGECGRVYDEPPEQCVCGSSDVAPRGAEGSPPGVLTRARAVLDPDAERPGLLADGPWVALLFRLVLVLSALATAAFAALVLL